MLLSYVIIRQLILSLEMHKIYQTNIYWTDIRNYDVIQIHPILLDIAPI